LNLKQISE
jgi:hypothetical protein